MFFGSPRGTGRNSSLHLSRWKIKYTPPKWWNTGRMQSSLYLCDLHISSIISSISSWPLRDGTPRGGSQWKYKLCSQTMRRNWSPWLHLATSFNFIPGKNDQKKKKTFIAQTTLKIQYWDNLLIKPETHKQSDLNNYNRVPPAKGFCVADVIRMLILYLARFVLMLK